LYFAERGDKRTDQLSFMELILASMVSKVIASTAAFPHEVLRVRQQVDRNPSYHMLDLIRSIYQKEGLKGFYSGLFTNLLRVVPAAAITFLSFEYISRGLMKFTDEHNKQKSEIVS